VSEEEQIIDTAKTAVYRVKTVLDIHEYLM
jgi:hypothetical protein